MGIVTTGIACSAGEHSAFMPLAGGFIAHVTRCVEPAMGAAIGWNFWYAIAITVPADISAAATLIDYWNRSVNTATEVVFSMFKIMLIIALILSGLIVDLGGGPDHKRTGFRHWRTPGAFNEYLVSGNTGRFLALWSIMLTAAFSYGNIQIVAISGTETRNPRKIIPSATRMTAIRVLVFYIISILIVGMVVPVLIQSEISYESPSDDPDLSNGGNNVKNSPFVIAFERAGISAFPSVINAIVITSSVSSVSACIFIASRTLYGLSRDGNAPEFFQRCNRFGTPHYAVGLTCLVGPLVYMTARGGTAASTTEVMIVFQWFVNVTSVAGLICWIVLMTAYLRFFYAMKKQNMSRHALYVIFKVIFGRRSRILSLDEIDLRTPFALMQQEITNGQYVPDKDTSSLSQVSDIAPPTSWKERTKQKLKGLKRQSLVRIWVWW
ncbi:hypothetical protein KEM54_005156 [Ascosphaera aggregata]|nr:hypothetical protein KEM54_005156 [Ascosphaera aggregata]